MSDNGSADREDRRKVPEDDVDSKQLTISYKRYYVDVKQNSRGRFIKITEKGTFKSRLVLSMAVAVELRDRLSDMITFADTLPAFKEKEAGEGTTLKSVTLVFDGRRYYLDLKENERGRFLRVAQTVFHPRVPRSQIAIPLEGLKDMRDTLTELLDKYSAGYLTEATATDQCKSKSITAENNKTFYFDVGHNDRGTFVRVTETGYTSSITIPKNSLGDFYKAIGEVLQEVSNTPASEAEK